MESFAHSKVKPLDSDVLVLTASNLTMGASAGLNFNSHGIHRQVLSAHSRDLGVNYHKLRCALIVSIQTARL